MTLKELARQDLLEAIARMEREPTIQNWLALDRLAYHYLLLIENEQQVKAFEAAQKAKGA